MPPLASSLLSDPNSILLWDLDGTIIDSSGDLARAINHLLRDYGYEPLDRATVVGHVGRGARNLVARCLEERGHALSTEEAVDRALDTFETHYRRALVVDTVVYPTIAETLLALGDEGRRMSLVTNKPEGPSREILDLLNLSSCFVSIVGGDTLPTRKPDPEPLRLAIRQCRQGMSRPESAIIMIGDTWVDVEAAQAAQVLSCGVGWGLGDRQAARAKKPDWWIDTPTELSELLRGDRI